VVEDQPWGTQGKGTHHMKITVFRETEGYKCERFSLSLRIWILCCNFQLKISGAFYLFPEHPIPLYEHCDLTRIPHINTQQSLACKKLCRPAEAQTFMGREKSLKIPTPEVSRNKEMNATTKRNEDASVLPKILE